MLYLISVGSSEPQTQVVRRGVLSELWKGPLTLSLHWGLCLDPVNQEPARARCCFVCLQHHGTIMTCPDVEDEVVHRSRSPTSDNVPIHRKSNGKDIDRAIGETGDVCTISLYHLVMLHIYTLHMSKMPWDFPPLAPPPPSHPCYT